MFYTKKKTNEQKKENTNNYMLSFVGRKDLAVSSSLGYYYSHYCDCYGYALSLSLLLSLLCIGLALDSSVPGSRLSCVFRSGDLLYNTFSFRVNGFTGLRLGSNIMYIYIYIERERDMYIYTYTIHHVYVCIYIYIYTSDPRMS